MKKRLLKLWYRLFPKKEIKVINEKLERALVDKTKVKLILLTEIKRYLLNELKIDQKSKFIPLSVRREVCTKVNAKFGKRMKASRVKININLKLVQL